MPANLALLSTGNSSILGVIVAEIYGTTKKGYALYAGVTLGFCSIVG